MAKRHKSKKKGAMQRPEPVEGQRTFRQAQSTAAAKQQGAPLSQPRRVNMDVDHLPPPATYPSISLCMIVKNEETYLADCLASVRELVSEMIIVDTGSTDRTVEIARGFGARVEHFAWINDFAAARNESIKYAAGDWIFWMDADDRLSPENAHRIKHAVTSAAAQAYVCQVFSPLGDGKNAAAASSTQHIRLFRNHLGLRFDGPVHESLFESIARQQVSLVRSNIQIEHIGYDVSPAAMRAKSERNKVILEACRAREPQNPKWRYYLGAGALQAEEIDTALSHFQAVLDAPSGFPGAQFTIYLAHIGRASAYHRRGDIPRARQAVADALAGFPRKRYLWGMAGMLALQADEPDAAVEPLQKSLSLPLENGVGPEWTDDILQNHLMQANLQLGHLDAARADLPAERVQSPDELQGVIQQALAPNANPNWADVVTWFSQLMLQTSPPTQWSTLANFSWQAGQSNPARRYARLALQQNPHDLAALNLLGLLALGDDDHEQAVTYFLQALQADPTYQPALDNLSYFCRDQQHNPAVVISQFAARLLAQADDQAAIDLLRLALDKFAAQAPPDTYKLLAAALHRTGQTEAALTVWQTAGL